MGTLILLRHGQSQWNLENRFAGWTDIPLTDRGRQDAAACAKVLKKFRFDRAFTSRLLRATQTLDVVLKELKQTAIPIEYDSALNERHYGDLQGLNKAETAKKFAKRPSRNFSALRRKRFNWKQNRKTANWRFRKNN